MGAFEEQQKKNIEKQLKAGNITNTQAAAARTGVSQAEKTGTAYTGKGTSTSTTKKSTGSTSKKTSTATTTGNKGYAYTDQYGFSHVVSNPATAQQYAKQGTGVKEYTGSFSGGYARTPEGGRISLALPGAVNYGNLDISKGDIGLADAGQYSKHIGSTVGATQPTAQPVLASLQAAAAKATAAQGATQQTMDWQQRLNWIGSNPSSPEVQQWVQNEITRAGQVYNQKTAAGDTAGAQAAHTWANQIRDAAGVAGQHDRTTGASLSQPASAPKSPPAGAAPFAKVTNLYPGANWDPVARTVTLGGRTLRNGVDFKINLTDDMAYIVPISSGTGQSALSQPAPAKEPWEILLESYKNPSNLEAARQEIARAGQVYNQKMAAGDTAGAEAAHRWANQIRDALGISDQYDRTTGAPLSQQPPQPVQPPPAQQPKPLEPWEKLLESYKNPANRQAALDEIARAGQVWQEKMAAGDIEGANRAHTWANQIREVLGISNQYDPVTGAPVAAAQPPVMPVAQPPAPAPAPGQTPPLAPAYVPTPPPANKYGSEMEDILSQLRAKINRPYNYTSRYESQINDILGQLRQNVSQPFNYNPATDPAYQSASNAITQSVMEQMNARGILNSTVTRDDVAAAVAKIIPELQSQAYQRHQGNIANTSGLLSAYSGLEKQGYERGLESYKTDISNVSDLLSAYSGLEQQEYTRGRQAQLDQWSRDDAKLKQEQDKLKAAMDRVKGLGYVDNVASVVLGIPVGTPSYEAQKDVQDRQSRLQVAREQIAGSMARTQASNAAAMARTQASNAAAMGRTQYSQGQANQRQQNALTSKAYAEQGIFDPNMYSENAPTDMPSGQESGATDDVQALIDQAVVNGYSPEEIRGFLEEDGLNPDDYGY